MAMITCPECGNSVSEKAKTCIHCGAPLIAEKNIVKVRTPASKDSWVKVTYTFTDDQTGNVLASINQNQVATFELDTPTTIRCHLGRGFKDGLIDYVPGGLKRYTITEVNTLFRAVLEFTEVDVFDSEN